MVVEFQNEGEQKNIFSNDFKYDSKVVNSI